ncbi:MAG: type II toxin-antitoxin system VapC family toxin [Magnetococcales bacterium]|nr:type II toxin-antitoxin system VapC family toxin [Magnetococcales bacterium]
MATRDGDVLFLDSNVLVYASVDNSLRHAECVAFLQRQEDAGVQLVISRQILREFMAVLSRPQPSRPPFPVHDIVSLVATFRHEWRVFDETEKVGDWLLSLVAEIPCGGKQIHDANIVATMLAYGITTLATYNVADFRRFGGHIRLVTPGEGGSSKT